MIFLIPTLNEEEGLKSLLPKIKKSFPDAKIVIIDKDSTDRTIEIAKQHDCRIMRQHGRGKGDAIKEALNRIDKEEDIILIDGDDTYDPKDVKKMLMFYDGSNIVIGNRLTMLWRFKRVNYMMNIIFSFIVSVLFLRKVQDLLSGLRVFKNKNIAPLLTKNGFEIEAEMTTKAIKNNIDLVFVPCSYKKRKGREKLKPFSDGWVILKEILKQRL